MSGKFFILLVLIVTGCSSAYHESTNEHIKDLNVRKLFKSKSIKSGDREVVVQYFSAEFPTTIYYLEKFKDGTVLYINGTKGYTFNKRISTPSSPIDDIYEYSESGKLTLKGKQYVGNLYKDESGEYIRHNYKVPVDVTYLYKDKHIIKEINNEEGCLIPVEDLDDILKNEISDFDRQVFNIERNYGRFYLPILEKHGIKNAALRKYWAVYFTNDDGFTYFFLIDGITGEIVDKISVTMRNS